MTYVGEARFRFQGAQEDCAPYIHVARVLVERTMAMHNIGDGGAGTATQTKTFPGGAWIRVSVFAQAPPIITISPTGGEAHKQTIVEAKSNYYFKPGFFDSGLACRYEPRSINDALDDLPDVDPFDSELTGKWLTGKKAERWYIGTAYYMSLDLRPDGQPRFLTAWQDGNLGELSNRPDFNRWNPGTTFSINAKPETAPSGVIGALVDKTQKAVFCQVSTVPLVIRRYDWDGETDAWVTTWTTNLPAERMYQSLHIQKSGLKGVCLVQAVVPNPNTSHPQNNTMAYPVAIEVDLLDGTYVTVAGAASDIIEVTVAETRVTGDSTFPDGLVYLLYTKSSITAGSETSVDVAGQYGDATLWRAMPRVGDSFALGGHDPAADQNSRITLTSVTYTPRPYTDVKTHAGVVFTGSEEPHMGQIGTIGFTWDKAGYTEDSGGVRTDTVHTAGTRLSYIGTSGTLERNHTFTASEIAIGRTVISAGYDQDDVVTYVVCDWDTEEQELQEAYNAGSQMIESWVFEQTDNSTMSIVGGRLNGFSIPIGTNSWGFTEIIDYTLTPAADPDRFSGYDWLDLSGSFGLYEYRERWYPTGNVVDGAGDVNGAGTDDLSISNAVMFFHSEQAAYLETFGFSYDLVDSAYPVSGVASANYETFGTGTWLNVTSVMGTGEFLQPYKDSYGQKIYVDGVLVADWRLVWVEDFGDGPYATDHFWRIGAPEEFLAAASYDATPKYVEWSDRPFSAMTSPSKGMIAADAYHNIIAVTEPWGTVNPPYLQRKQAFGYVRRAVDGHVSDDPRTLFLKEDGSGLPVDELGSVGWGHLTSEIKKEVRDATKDDAGTTFKRNDEPTYRRP